MKFLIAIVMLQLFCTGIFCVADTNDFNAIDSIKQKGNLIVVVPSQNTAAYRYPFKSLFSADEKRYLKIASDQLAVNLQIVEVDSFQHCIKMIQNGDADIAAGRLRININDATNLQFTIPYAQYPCYLFYKRDEYTIKKSSENSFYEVPPKQFGCSIRSAAVDLALKNGIVPRYYENDVEAFLAMRNADIQMCAVDYIVYDWIITSCIDILVYYRCEKCLDTVDSYGFAVAWNNDQLCRFLNAVISVAATTSKELP